MPLHKSIPVKIVVVGRYRDVNGRIIIKEMNKFFGLYELKVAFDKHDTKISLFIRLQKVLTE